MCVRGVGGSTWAKAGEEHGSCFVPLQRLRENSPNVGSGDAPVLTSPSDGCGLLGELFDKHNACEIYQQITVLP